MPYGDPYKEDVFISDDIGQGMKSTGSSGLHESFADMLGRRYRERLDLMRDLIRVEKDITAIQSILNR